ncbi:MAG: DUF4393 domain-containing protein [Campylobacterales bacterium]|nr:DUF4393 domain-containing protein [Campylobacterales bacterium]
MDLPVKVDLSESGNAIIKDLGLPAAKQFGLALGNVFGLLHTATLPLKFINTIGNTWYENAIAKRNIENLADKMKDIPEEKIKEVEPEIAIPILERLSYTSNSDLANAFANLLANASNKDKVDLIHPGFINKLEDLAPDEARILGELKTLFNIPYIHYRVKDIAGNSKVLSLNLTGIELSLGLSIKNMAIHLDNLESLNILKDEKGSFMTNEEVYNELKEQYSESEKRYKDKIDKKEYGDGMSIIDVQKSFYSVTPLGRTFIEACTDSNVKI